MDLTDWLDLYSGPGFIWYAKRLSGNDTLANGAHQAGPYIPREFLFQIFPVLNHPEVKNPDIRFNLYIDSHADHRLIRAVWYNNKLHENPEGGRNETRLTGFGGSSSALLDPDSTGALTVFAFQVNDAGEATECHVWVCRHETEEDLVEERIGPVEPGSWSIWSAGLAAIPSLFGPAPAARTSCRLSVDEIPAAWLAKFPTGAEIIRKTVELRADVNLPPDRRLLRRRECEFDVFRSVEEATELTAVRAGFATIDDFVAKAQSILQRRKSRSGNSLELHTEAVFIEEGLRAGTDFDREPESEPEKYPDFLFPSAACYRDSAFPQARLRMLAVKTTCKDRWRQILNEANRIPRKHLLTLQEGVSEGQFREMTEAGVQLVIPTPLVDSFPASIRPHLQSLESFIADVRLLTVT